MRCHLFVRCAFPAFLSACFGSHGAAGSPDASLPRDDASIARDASTPRDAPTPRDARPARDAWSPPDAGSCARPGAGRPWVEVAAIGTGAESRGCFNGGSFEGAALYAATALGDGVELSLDLCPDADDDCRCAVTVRYVGADALPELAPGGPISGTASSYGVLLEGAPGCPECEGSIRPIIFYAAFGPPDSPHVRSDALTLRFGDRSCTDPPDPSGCVLERYYLTFTAFTDGFPGPIGFETALDEGTTARLEPSGVAARVLFSTNMVCPGTAPSAAAWVAWR